MPYCPKCRYEYRPDIKQCPDCNVELLDDLPPEKIPQEVELVCIRSYMAEIDAQMDSMKLISNGIPAVIKNEAMSQTDMSLAFAEGGIMLMVRKEHAYKARKILESE